MDVPYQLLSPLRVVIISASYGGKDNFMPATWCFPLSFKPALFGIAISPMRFTHGLIKESKEFAINIPGDELVDVIEKFGRISGRDLDKFEKTGLTREKSEKINAVSIKECLSTIECKVIDEHTEGDHTIFVGEVVNIKIRKEGKGLYEGKGVMLSI